MLQQKEQSSAFGRNSADETDEITLKTLRKPQVHCTNHDDGNTETLSTGQRYEQSFHQNGGAQTRHPIPCTWCVAVARHVSLCV